MNISIEPRKKAKLYFFISIILLTFSIFGESIILKTMPKYSEFNKNVVKNTFKNLDVDNSRAVNHAALLLIRSNELYSDVQRVKNTFAYIALVFIVLGFVTLHDTRLTELEKKVWNK